MAGAGDGRRVSPLRVVMVLVTLAIAAPLAAAVVQRELAAADEPPAAWFAPYVDVTLTPRFEFERETVRPTRDLVLGFVVADRATPCEPSWGGAYRVDEAATALDLDRRIARVRAADADVIVSFGGQANRELALDCTDEPALLAAYRTVIDRYHSSVVDFDIEGDAIKDTAASARRARAVKVIQDEARAGGRGLAVWLTLPVAPSGMTAEGVAVIDAMLAAGVDLTGVNLMTMDYGASKPDADRMVDASTRAVQAAHRQLDGAYRRAGVSISKTRVWGKLGITPMIGQNDVAAERVTLADAAELLAFAQERGLGRISMWSINRDLPCGPNITDTSRVNNNCSGVEQEPLAFTRLFDVLPGRARAGAHAPTVPEPRVDPVDDPATAPYPIWRSTKGYLEGNKVVWHGNVYQAKWWNQGATPDAPIVNEWDTPWRIIGPVLPSDRPASTTTLAAGTYPAWSAGTDYAVGARVLHRGLPYEAKWFTRGAEPGADVPNPWDTPWRPLAPAPGEETTTSTR